MSYIPLSWRITIGALIVLAALGGSFYAGWHVRSLSCEKAQQQAVIAAQAAFNAQLQSAIKDRDALYLQLQAANDQATADYRKAQHETNNLRNRVESGAVGLRINNATCSSSVPKASTSASLDNGTGATLNATARQDYFALRNAIDDTEAKLKACQGELKVRVGM